MSWGGQYSGYGQGGGYASAPPAGAPPAGAPPAYGNPAGYQQQAQAPAYGQPYNHGPPPQQYGGYQPQQQPPQYGQPPGYGHPQTQGYGGYGSPPPPGVRQDLWEMFLTVDQDRSGQITAEELRNALLNGNWSPFNPETCRLMIGMFDKDRSGTINIHEFSALWEYIQEWKKCFERFDTDRSGNIDSRELHTAFQTFGYNLSPQFCDTVIRTFDRRGTRNINFDDFIQACVMLKTLTDKFRVKDTQQRGVIQISYEDFLEMVLDNTLMSIK